jgi:hypothetical protein
MKILSPHGALTITVTAYGLCPANAQKPNVVPMVQTILAVQQDDDASNEGTTAPVAYSLDPGEQSTSGVPLPFNNFNWPVPQRRSTHAHLITSSTNAALLFGDKQ